MNKVQRQILMAARERVKLQRRHLDKLVAGEFDEMRGIKRAIKRTERMLDGMETIMIYLNQFVKAERDKSVRVPT